MSRFFLACLLIAATIFPNTHSTVAQEYPDSLREFQYRASALKKADWIHWGDRKGTFSNWTNHSNRLIPAYSFGVRFDSVRGENSVYRDKAKLTKLYGQLPTDTLNPKAEYFDQTDIYHLQKQAWKAGKKNVILIVFDGMDWQTIQAASIYKNKEVLFTEGKGSGLAFLDYEKGNPDFGYFVTSPHNADTKKDVDAQAVTAPGTEKPGGYSPLFGGATPWSKPGDPSYLIGKRKELRHAYTDSAASATSLNTGKKTFSAAINVGPNGEQFETLAHEMQKEGFAIGVVTNVPISHATPACVYSHNVSRYDNQDLSRDLVGLRSISHPDEPLSGVDVLIGCGWNAEKANDKKDQGNNYVPGNEYLPAEDVAKIDIENGGKYVVAQRTRGTAGIEVLSAGAKKAREQNSRLFGFFGGSHLPYQTADGNFDPTNGDKKGEKYKPANMFENPTLAQMAEAALSVLEKNEKGFYLMVETGDVDWANHNNNIDDAIGAVISGDEMFVAVTKWVEENSNWDETCLILTADHGHMMVLDDPTVLTGERELGDQKVFDELLAIKQKADAEEKRIADEKKAAEKKAAAEKAKASSESN
ncbi:MAG: alkaline phosphatase [Mariniblastus sp.]